MMVMMMMMMVMMMRMNEKEFRFPPASCAKQSDFMLWNYHLKAKSRLPGIWFNRFQLSKQILAHSSNMFQSIPELLLVLIQVGNRKGSPEQNQPHFMSKPPFLLGQKRL